MVRKRSRLVMAGVAGQRPVPSWKSRKAVRQQCHKIAKAKCAIAFEEQRDMTPPDGSLAYRLALREETAALTDYRRVLGIFMDLVVKNKLPPEE